MKDLKINQCYLALKKTFLPHIIVGIVAIISSIFTPLNSIIRSWIWKEKALVTLKMSNNSEYFIGQEIRIQTIVSPLNYAPLSDGTLTISYPSTAFNTKDLSIFQFSDISSTMIFPSSSNLTLTPTRLGVYDIIAELQTRHSKFSDTIRIKVTSVEGRPSRFNWTGNWDITMGNQMGKIKLIEDRSSGGISLLGEYHFENGDFGTVSGKHDGTTFSLELIPKRGRIRKYFLDGLYNLPQQGNDRFIEIKGQSCIELIKNEEWITTKQCVPFTMATIVD